jgi:ABC transport system ATP-binding/permease protein
VVLAAAEVAPLQATVTSTDAGHVIVDAGSRFGTYVNGDRLIRNERRPLDRGDTIAVAQHVFHYAPAGDQLPRLAPITPVDAGRVRTAKDKFSIGRDPSCDLVLDHPTVSRHHAVIHVLGGDTWIEDMGSATGTRVNGIGLRRTSLSVGDQIAIGPYRIVFDGEDLIERAPARGLAVTALGVAVAIDGRAILQPTSLQVRPGELVAIIGESGAGKSTLLKTLAGVTQPTAGRVLAGGEPLQTRLAEIGYVPQFDIVHGALTVSEALDYAARLRLPVDLAASERAQRVQDIMRQLQLSDRADVPINVISGGQRKRVAVGTELLHAPGALFLDEPTTGLDPGLERRLMELFRKLANGGQTVALVTHATGSIALCDRVLVMGRGGVLLFDGKPEGVLETLHVPSFEAVYEALAQAPSQEQRRASAPLLPVSRERPQTLKQPMVHQTRVLASRYATLVRRDKRHLKGALIQVPILGILTALLFPRGVFAHAGSVHASAGKAAQLLFLMTTVALWLGSINAAREVVKERNVIRRELAVGVQIRSYVASKLLVLLAFSAAQTFLFACIVFLLQPLHEPLSRLIDLMGVLILTSWIAVLMGLVVSATASSEDQATAIIPLLLVPQLLLGGAIVTLRDMSVTMHGLAELIPARWGFAASGSAIHLQDRIASDRQFAAVTRYGPHFFALSPGLYLIVVGAFAVVMTGALATLLKRERDPHAS